MAAANHDGEEIGQSAEPKARRVIDEELATMGWKESDLGWRRKGDPWKVRIARRLRRETTLSKRWIARPLAQVRGQPRPYS